MPARRTQGPPADPFPTAAAKKALPDAEVVAPRAETAPTTDHASPRYLLPKDLPGALRHLHDGELDALFEATIEELKRRDRLPFRLIKETPARAMSHQRPADNGSSLTKGQLNAVRAAFKAGVKPAAIARQFGISQSDLRKALASDVRRKPGP
jgi:hypothetical protein